MQLSAQFRETTFTLSILVLAALAATTALLMLNLGSSKIVFAIAGALLFVFALVACGNVRLFCLWGLLMSAPFALNISFVVVAHMGGASAISIDAVDIFLIPLVLFLFRDLVTGNRQSLRVPKVLYWWLGLILLGCLDMVFAPMKKVAFLEVFRMIKLSLLFWVIVNEVVRVRQFAHVIAALMIGVAFQSMVALLQYTLDINFGAQILGEVTEAQTEFTSIATYRGGFTNRVGGMIGHPNLLSIYLAMLMPIGISILFSNVKPLYKFLIIVTVLMGAASLVLTLSRSGWISFALAFMLLMGISFLHPELRRRYIFGRLFTIIFIVLVAMALSGPIVKRLTQSDGNAISFRWEFMEVATDMALDKPLLGFGLNSFVWHMPPYTDYKTYQGVIDKFGDDLPVVHNIYLLVLSEQGIIGLILFLGFNAHLMLIAWRGLRTYSHPFLAMISVGSMAGMLALSADGMASFFIRNANCGRVFFIVAALVVAVQWWHTENNQNRRVIRKFT
ncbi:MAG: O-antigen ligase family protein [Halioglobus sp.]